MTQRKFLLGRLVIVIVVTTLNLYYTGPVATFVRLNIPNFRIFRGGGALSLFFVLKLFFEQI